MKRTGFRQLSEVCRSRRLQWFGHVVREGPGCMSYEALMFALDTDDIHRPRGRPPMRWVDVVRQDLERVGLSVEVALKQAADQNKWSKVLSKSDRCG